MHTKLLFLLTTTLLLAAPVAPAQVVTSNADAGAGSLRAVVAAASPGATITFATGLSGQTIADPVLAPLGNYGGPTQTMPPQPGSPALDTGADSATNSFTTDQRGGWRRSGASVDIGAVEVVAASGVPAVLTGLTRLTNGVRQFSFTNLVAAGFTVWASTNVAAPCNTWSNLGPAVETPLGSGQYRFTDPAATNNPQRFYRVLAEGLALWR